MRLATIISMVSAVCGCALLVATWSSYSRAVEVPGSAPIPTRPILERIAQEYWSKRGYTLPTPVELYVMPIEANIAGRGELGGTRIWIARDMFFPFQEYARCLVYVHERGHNLGLDHDSGWPIMAPELHSGEVVPLCLRYRGG